jgi:hypothetical protein
VCWVGGYAQHAIRRIDPRTLAVNRSWQLFFEPIQLRLDSADLLVELRLQSLMLGAGGLGGGKCDAYSIHNGNFRGQGSSSRRSMFRAHLENRMRDVASHVNLESSYLAAC